MRSKYYKPIEVIVVVILKVKVILTIGLIQRVLFLLVIVVRRIFKKH